MQYFTLPHLFLRACCHLWAVVAVMAGLVVVHMCHGLWVMVKGTCHCGCGWLWLWLWPGWRWWWAVVAVGNRCVCTGCGPWSSFVVHLLFHGCCGHLWLFVFVGIVVCGCYGQSSPFAVWVVVMCLDGGSKEKRNHVIRLFWGKPFWGTFQCKFWNSPEWKTPE